jgi:gas vesicle protein
MAELEIHHEVEHEHDSFGRTIGIIAAVIGVLLAFDTIASHRAHTAAVEKKTEANDEWAYYQSKSIKRVQYVVAGDLAKLTPNSTETLEKFEKEQERYREESEESRKKAEAIENETKVVEARALRYDFGEGLLELGLVLCSLYFISKRKLFPFVGVAAAMIGAVTGATGLFIH